MGIVALALSFLAAMPLIFVTTGPAFAATFTVNSTADEVDSNPGNGVCETAPGNGVCTLRAAIQEANALAGADTIILPAGTYTLNRSSGDDTATNGDLDINGDLNIVGAGALVTAIDGNGLDRVFDVRSGTVSISNLEIRNGNISGSDGGGIRNSTTLTLTDVSVANNTAKNGGGIMNDGTITLTRVTLRGNTATSGTGGGIQSGGSSPLNYLTNVTISGNSATGDGGGAEFDHAQIVNVTISNNSSPTSGGLNKRGGQSHTLKNTIIAGNTGATQCTGTPSSLGNNLSSDGSCSLTGPGDLPNTNPLLGPLQNNGGSTQTHALLTGSPAIDNGTGVGAPATDQRGIARPQGAGYDIGAYELIYLTISGTVFEDVNYGGGAGRSLAASSGVVRSGARVELYDGGGSYVTFATTDGSGNYSFTGLTAASYTVRVVSSSVTSSRTGYVAGLLPVQTFRTNASTGTAVGVTDYVGGHDPATGDAGNAAGGWNLNGSTGVFSGSGSGKAHAFAPVTVSAANVTGVDFGFDFDTIVNTNNSGQGSLRQFITNANTLGGDASLVQSGLVANKENAVFMISNGTAGSGLRSSNNYFSGGFATISPASALPTISTVVVLDAQKQPGWTSAPIIELNGTNAGAASNGLTLTAGGSTVSGMVINRFTGTGVAGIAISGTGNNTIQGNYLGTDSAGAATSANYQGILIDGTSGNVIGGASASQRNVVAGNTWRAIMIQNGSSGNILRGNYVGLNAAGTAALANNIGVYLNQSPNNTVGGTAAGEGNVVSGNSQIGIYLVYPGASGNVFQGNTVGLNAGRTAPVPNGTSGIEFCCTVGGGPINNTIGGGVAGAANVISGNGNNGILLRAGTGNAILRNSLYGNGWIGIDLGSDNVTVNNGTKNGALPNSDMDYPVFDNAVLSGTTLTVSGYVGSARNQATFANARVEIFKSDSDPSGFGEGQTYLGFLTADANGNFSGNLTVGGLAPGDKITGTATDGSNNTSEFGPDKIVYGTANLVLTLSDNPDPAASGGDLLYKMLIVNNGPDTATSVVATNVLPASVTLVSATPSQGSCSGTTTVTCNLGSILNSGTTSVDILVITSTTGTITDNASVTSNENDPVPGNNTATTTTSVVVGASTGVPLTQYRRIHNFVDYTVTGGTLRTQPNTGNPCLVGASSTAALSGIPVSSTVVGAYLYWAGSGSTVDSQVSLNGTPITADRTFTARYVLSPNNYDYFGGFKDVTAQVQTTRNGNYTFTNLTVDTGNPYCSLSAVLAGWSLIVIYQDTSVTGKTLVLYDGFDIQRNGSTSYNLTGIFASTPPEGKATYLVWEGDPDLSGANEKLVFNGTSLSDALNPVNNTYNSTINTLGVSTSYGVDLDTFNVSSYITGGDTLATTTVSVASDLVILNAVLLQVKSNIITGKVFEDVNYGGGAGRDLAMAVASAPGFTVPRPGAVVELYDASGSFLRTTTTDAGGRYGFSGLPDGDFIVRAVNDNVSSSRPGATGNERAVQTYRTDASTGVAAAVTNEVGGTNPAGQDAPANTTNANLGSFLAQSKAPAKIITGLAVTDVDFGFNFDTVVNANNSGQGSLRQVMTNANALGNGSLAQSGRPAGIESAIFMISNGSSAPGLRAANNYFSGGVATISPTSALPTITDPVILDAQMQPGWTSAPIIELNGTGAGAASNGLSLTAGGSTVRGLAINRFTGTGVAGIALSGTGNNTIQGNYLGTDSAGAAASPNYYGLYVNGVSGNVIGGTTASVRNVISGNSNNGIYVSGAGATGNTVQGNYIGTNAAGGAAVANGGSGVAVQGGSSNAVGGTASNTGNLIAYNGVKGVIVTGSGATGNAIRRNSSYGNSGIGIDLGNDNVTVNNGTKNGTLPNSDMDYPVFTSAILNGTTLTVSGYVGNVPNLPLFSGAQVEIFKSDNDPSGYGEGQTYLGVLTADGNGNFSGNLTVGGLAAGDKITGTATDGSNNTSEFGANGTVGAPSYQPDALIKLSSEGAGGYLTDNLYEATATVQVKSQGVLSGSMAAYNVQFQNDGNLTDNLVITGTGSGSGFTVQYLDNTSTDRTAAVTGSGYTISGMAVGAGTVWTVNVTPSGNPTPVEGGSSYNVLVTATSANDVSKKDQVKAVTSSTSAHLTLLKSADKASYNPGEDIVYTVNASNGSGLTSASTMVVTDNVPANTGFKVGGATFNQGTSTLTATISYSNNGGSTYAYTPASGGCTAPAGYDYCVTNVRWTMAGTMTTGASFSVGLVVRVK